MATNNEQIETLLESLRNPHSFDRTHAHAVLEALVRHAEPADVHAASLIPQITESNSDTTMYQEKYQEVYGSKKRLTPLPEHKVRWYMQAVDLVVKAIRLASDQRLSLSTTLALYNFSDLPQLYYVNPVDEDIWEKPENWPEHITSQDQMDTMFIGDYKVKEAVLKHSHFSAEDYRGLLQEMMSKGDIDLDSKLNYYLPREK